MTGGENIGRVLERHGVRFLFTLCGGHISPILVGAEARGVRIVDVRHEVTAVFAADAVARLSGVPGVAAVTAGPGATNTITALKNAQMAQSPLVLLVGATATVLEGRGSLQDIDQAALLAPHVKHFFQAKRVRQLAPMLEEALEAAASGVPGPVAVECPVDLLYPEELVRSWYAAKTEGAKGLGGKALAWYLRRHLDRVFAPGGAPAAHPAPVAVAPVAAGKVARTATAIAGAERPLLVIGSQAMLEPAHADELAEAVSELGLPVYLGGMARGLLGRDHPLQLRHGRRKALKEADLVLLAGFPCDFRMDYGAHVRRGATLVSVNRSPHDLRLNRKPDLAVLGDPGRFLRALAAALAPQGERLRSWLTTLRARDDEREAAIDEQAAAGTEHVNPIALCRALDEALPDDSVLVADGGDFVATAAYTVSPRGPLRWLDPGVFGTLGVGAGFALGAKLCRPEAEVWIVYGDGSAGYSVAEFDTFVRHGLPVIALVGNDASWAQIAREQVEILGTDLGTVLARSDYHAVAEGWGGKGLLLRDPAETESTLRAAQQAAAAGSPVLINAWLGSTDFRKGSISM
jgi:acetolactate synthase-1/2/3 large subunit